MKEGKFHHALNIREDLCIGCSHCMNVCPTEAIRVKNGKSVLSGDRCVDCGECFRVCPVGAIIINHDDFNYIFDYKYRVALVPAIFTGQFPEDIPLKQIYSAILDLGFTHIYEVENGVVLLAESVNELVQKNKNVRPFISSFCPSIIRLIQVKFPALVDNIIRLKPPLDISADFVKRELMNREIPDNEIGIFYITPCAAKIAAIKDPVGESFSQITGVINMDFLYNKVYRIVKQHRKNPLSIQARGNLSSKSTCWSLTNGEAAHTEGRCLAIDEIHNVIAFLEKIENNEITGIDFLELRACDESCAGGVLTTCNRFLSVERLRSQEAIFPDPDESALPIAFRKIETESNYLKEKISIEPIRPRSILKLDENMAEAMKKMEKINRTMQLLPMVDCGICGAPTCLALAQDIALGNGNLRQCIFIQKILEQKGEMSLEESVGVMQSIWGFGKTNKYRDIKGN